MLCSACLPGEQVLADNSGLLLKTGPNVEVSGDAIVNNRKKKLIPSYELEVKGTWSGDCLPLMHSTCHSRQDVLTSSKKSFGSSLLPHLAVLSQEWLTCTS